jgi:hypothetical protein
VEKKLKEKQQTKFYVPMGPVGPKAFFKQKVETKRGLTKTLKVLS